jgi:uncharacterized protein
MIRGLLALLALLAAGPALAVDFPRLSGRVVDQAELLDPAQEAALTQRLEALQRATSRQLVVATVSSLQDLAIEDYGYQLGRAWNIGQRGANNGVILLVAPNERKARIEVGYGLEPIMTDALSSQIIRDRILPRFRDRDYPGGIDAGADAIIRQLQAPPEAAERAALAAQQAENQSKARRHGRGGTPPILALLFWGGMLFIIIVPLIGAGFGGRRYRRGVSIWGPSTSSGDNGFGWMLAGMVLGSLNDRHRGGGWGGGGSSWGGGGWGGGGGGGFSGGGGSFGGGGASGGW